MTELGSTYACYHSFQNQTSLFSLSFSTRRRLDTILLSFTCTFVWVKFLTWHLRANQSLGAKIQVLWNVTPCRLVKICQHFERSLHLHFHGQAAFFFDFLTLRMKAIRYFKILITCTSTVHLNFQQHLCKNFGSVTYTGYLLTGAEGNVWT